MSDRLRIVFFGSGEFGVPTLKNLVTDHDIALVVTQPDRPAGRKRCLAPTPIGALAESFSIPVFKPQNPNDPASIGRIHDTVANAFVVIAYGHKLSPALLGETFAINLHASILPKFRGAAPINWAMIRGEGETGVSVIALAQRMDAGEIYAQQATPINPRETAGELHGRLADLGPAAIAQTLRQFKSRTLQPQQQDEMTATLAPKLKKSDGTVDFNHPAVAVRNRIHGLTPWPGAAVEIDGRRLTLVRAEIAPGDTNEEPGVVRDDFTIACAEDAIRLIDVQSPGSRVMTFDEYRHGHAVRPGSVVHGLDVAT